MKWLAILALFGAVEASAQETAETPDFSAMSEAELLRHMDAAVTQGFPDACRIEVPLFAEVLKRYPDAPPARSGILTAKAFCALREDRYAEGLQLLKQAEATFPDGPAFPGLGLFFAMRLEDGTEALARLRSIAGYGQLHNLPRDMAYGAIRTVHAAGLGDELDAFAYELAAMRTFERLDPDIQGSFAVRAIRHAVKIDDLTRIDELLDSDLDPPSYLSMLSDRNYEAAWPQIEEHAGDNLSKVADAHVARAAERLAEEPEDRDRLSSYAYALLYAGRYREAVELARNWRPERDDLAGLEEGDGWAINIEAYALDALGRTGEADAVFDQLATLSADENAWVVNFVINRASRLVGQERWNEGLAATELARAVAEKHGTTYAKLLIARDRACAFERLGRSEHARREAEFLVANFAESPPVGATGLMCVGQRAEAERLVAAAFSDEVARDRLISDLQDVRFDMFYTPSALPQVRELILATPGLRDEAFKHARLLPERFVPISYIRRSRIADAAP